MKLVCFGSRGSLPSPNRNAEHVSGAFSTTKYGGNTTSYFLEAGPFLILIDAGSGIRECGNYLMKNKMIGKNFIHVFSHYHSDHIQGLGFCVPYYIKNNTFHIHGPSPEGKFDTKFIRNVVEQTLSDQYDPPYFPVTLDAMPAEKVYHAHEHKFSETIYYSYDDCPVAKIRYIMHENEQLADPSKLLKITTIPLHHPNGSIGYRFDYMGKSFTFCTDNEPYVYANAQINKHANGTDLLLLDGQYSSAQLSGMTQGFGHGEWKICIEQAIACQAKSLLIHHLDPADDDSVIEQRENDMIKHHSGWGSCTLKSVEFAKEGKVWEI